MTGVCFPVFTQYCREMCLQGRFLGVGLLNLGQIHIILIGTNFSCVHRWCMKSPVLGGDTPRQVDTDRHSVNPSANRQVTRGGGGEEWLAFLSLLSLSHTTWDSQLLSRKRWLWRIVSDALRNGNLALLHRASRQENVVGENFSRHRGFKEQEKGRKEKKGEWGVRFPITETRHLKPTA